MIVRRVACGIAVTASMFVFVNGAAADKLSALQKHFDHENNPVHRAKLVEKLGDEEFEIARQAFKKNDFVTVGTVFEKYRDNVRAALQGLKKKHPDAERDSDGYRQLEINTRRGIREVDEVLLMAPEAIRPPLQIVRGDLDAMDREMIGMLFRHPGDQPIPGGKPAPAATTTAPEVKP
jgi:hypothetical protein